MTSLAWLIPTALALGALGLVAFLWSLNSGQFDDLEGASWRAIDDEVPRAKRLSHNECGVSEWLFLSIPISSSST